MTNDQKELIKNYLASIASLFEAKLIRSAKVLGDLAEWFCVQRYGLVLEKSGRHPGYDGRIGKFRVQVKAHNSPEGTNLNVGNPEKYDELIVLIGPLSRLRVGPPGLDFHVYRFPANHVKAFFKKEKGCYCAKKGLLARDFEVIELD